MSMDTSMSDYRLQVKFWGVRGSKPTPGRNTILFGGNTSCVEVLAQKKVEGDDWQTYSRVIFDAGTGIANLGQEYQKAGLEADVFFSHLHWDHIQGLPFFAPLYVPGNIFRLYGENKDANGMSFQQVIEKQMRPPHFPITMQMMKSQFKFIPIEAGQVIELPVIEGAQGLEGTQGLERARIISFPVNHPNGCLSYRIELADARVVFATDTEPMESEARQADFLNFIKGAQVFIYDTHFTDAEYFGQAPNADFSHKKGWGHSTWQEGTRLAKQADLDYLVLFHHKEDRRDRDQQEIEIFARQEHAKTVAAREGMTMNINAGGEAAEKVVINYPY